MQKLFKNKVSLYSIALVMWSSTILAQGDPGLPGDGNGFEDPGQPAAPIDAWLPIMLLLGIALVFYYTKKRKALQF